MSPIPVINMDATGKNITQLRKAASVTVRQLQDILGFGTPQAIYKWQNGSAMPTLDNLVILAAVLGVGTNPTSPTIFPAASLPGFFIVISSFLWRFPISLFSFLHTFFS